MSTKLSVNISNDTARALRDLADKKETTVTDIVRRATVVYQLLATATADGKTVQLIDRTDDSITQMEIP